MEQWQATLVAAVAAPTLTVVLASVLGQHLTRRSDLLKRRSELALDALERLYQGYADTVSLGRRWITVEGVLDDDTRSELLESAYEAEDRLEALLIKLASERSLEGHDLDLLGAFRQAHQQVRESIRDQRKLGGTSSVSEDYRRLKTLTAAVAAFIAAEPQARRQPTELDAAKAWLTITSSRYEDKPCSKNERNWRKIADERFATLAY